MADKKKNSGSKVGKNVHMTIEGNFLVLKIDLTKDYGPSSTGKTTIVASTEGNQEVEGHAGMKFGLNVYKK